MIKMMPATTPKAINVSSSIDPPRFGLSPPIGLNLRGCNEKKIVTLLLRGRNYRN